MRILKRLSKAIATAAPYAVPLLTIFVSAEIVAACQTDDLNQPGPVGAIAQAAEAAEQELTKQLDKLDGAICSVLAQLEYACTHGFV